MTNEEKMILIEKQRIFFRTGKTLPLKFRIAALRRLKAAIHIYREPILAALKEDLGKSETEAYMCEVGMAMSEISYMLKHLPLYASDRLVHTPLSNFPAVSRVRKCPYGNVLIMSPWNYPFLLTIEPLVDAIAAGNTAILKPSAYSPATAKVVAQMIKETFPEKFVAVVTGGRAENAFLLQQKFDYIFFTGSQAVGKEVLRRAAEHLTPVTLELGGKSPVIVDETADLPMTARRIVFAKYLNCGQTCVAPDYILCSESVRDELIELMQAEIVRQFGDDPLHNEDYGKIINEKHFHRILGLIDENKLVWGGSHDSQTLKIEPSIMKDVTWDDDIMGQEIFGPVLPVLTYTDLSGAIRLIEDHAHPLALYIFSRDRAAIRRVTSLCRYGGGCINDCIVHLSTSQLPFGGVGESGMGAYHGRRGFDTFTHEKSIMDKKLWLDLPIRYQPYTEQAKKMIRMFLK